MFLVDHKGYIDNATPNIFNIFGILEDDFKDYTQINDYFANIFITRDEYITDYPQEINNDILNPEIKEYV